MWVLFKHISGCGESSKEALSANHKAGFLINKRGETKEIMKWELCHSSKKIMPQNQVDLISLLFILDWNLEAAKRNYFRNEKQSQLEILL